MTESSHDLDRTAEPNTVAATPRAPHQNDAVAHKDAPNENYTTYPTASTDAAQIISRPPNGGPDQHKRHTEVTPPQRHTEVTQPHTEMHPTRNAQRADTSATVDTHPNGGWIQPNITEMHPTRDAQRADTSATKAAHPNAGWSQPDILRQRAENANGAWKTSSTSPASLPTTPQDAQTRGAGKKHQTGMENLFHIARKTTLPQQDRVINTPKRKAPTRSTSKRRMDSTLNKVLANKLTNRRH